MKRILLTVLAITLCLTIFSGCNKECEHNWERIGNYNESTAQDKCTKCGETRLYTDPNSIDPSHEQSETEKFTYSGEMVIKAINFSSVEATTESQLILDLLNNGEWIDTLCDCINDYTISLNGKVIRYSSGCGTFNNITDGTSLTLSDDEKASVNENLERLFAYRDPDVQQEIYDYYSVTIINNFPIVNQLEDHYWAGETVTIKLETITEHYYTVEVNGEDVEMDVEKSDLEYTYFTFTMPYENTEIYIEEHWVDIPAG